MQPTATQGTDRKVKTRNFRIGAGAGQVLMSGLTPGVFRIVGFQVSMDAAGTCCIYHGNGYNSDAVIVDGFFPANGGSNMPTGDWADQGGFDGDPITADVAGGNARIVLQYIEIKVLG